uniref:Uncharacterized protein LOC102806456 n=1 Tax=Saccoglossus kowalevskii TaxID=10224 RepID=A0ABM0MPV2_SACKO|nr:PREDICTED: uncharacterized protein LOC102806456 [Saccoglossus kowalevskii]
MAGSNNKVGEKCKENNESEFFCELCNLDYFTRTQFEEHDWSLLHHQRMEKVHGKEHAHVCSLCHFSCTGLSAYGKHLISLQHRAGLERRRHDSSSPTRNLSKALLKTPVNNDLKNRTPQHDSRSRYDQKTPAGFKRNDDRPNKPSKAMNTSVSNYSDDNHSQSSYYHTFEPALRKPEWERDYPQDTGQYNYYNRPHSAQGFYRGIQKRYPQERSFLPQESFRSYNRSFHRENYEYASPARIDNTVSKNWYHEDIGWRTSTPVNERDYPYEQQNQDRHHNKNQALSVYAHNTRTFVESSYVNRVDEAVNNERFRYMDQRRQGTEQLIPRRKSYSTGGIPVSELGASFRKERSIPVNDRRVEYSSTYTSIKDNNTIPSCRSPVEITSTTPDTMLGNVNIDKSTRDKSPGPITLDELKTNSFQEHAKELSRSTVVMSEKNKLQEKMERLQEIRAKKEQLVKNQERISLLKQRLARGFASRNQQHVDDMDKSLKSVYAKELERVQPPDEPQPQETTSLVEPFFKRPSQPNLSMEHNCPPVVKRTTDNKGPLHHKKMQHRDRKSDSVNKNHIDRHHSSSDALRQTDEVHELNSNEFEMQVDTDSAEGIHFVEPQFDSYYTESTDEDTASRKKSPCSPGKYRKQRYSRSDSYPPYPQVSHQDNQNRPKENDDGDCTSSEEVPQYQRFHSHEYVSSESSEQESSLDLSKLNLPQDLQKELSKHIRAQNIAKSQGIVQPNLGHARSRLHVGQRPKSGDKGVEQRLLQMLSSPHSRHRQDKQFERLKQHVQSTKPPSKLPRFGLQLLPSQLTLPQILQDTDSQVDDVIECQNENIIELDSDPPSPNSLSRTKRSHADIEANVSSENVTSEILEDAQTKRRKMKENTIQEAVVELEDNKNEDSVTACNVDVTTLYQISLQEEELHRKLSASERSIVEMRSYIQNKIEELRTMEAQRAQICQEMQGIRDQRMMILKGAVSERKVDEGTSISFSTPMQERRDKISADTTTTDKEKSMESSKPETNDACQPMKIKSEPIDTDYAKAEKTVMMSSSSVQESPGDSSLTTMFEQFTKNPKKFEIEPVDESVFVNSTQQNGLQVTVKTNKAGKESHAQTPPIDSTNSAKNLCKDSSSEITLPKSCVSFASDNKQKSQTVGVQGTTDKPVNEKKKLKLVKDRKIKSKKATVSEDEVAPHVRSMEELQNSAPYEVAAINASSATLRQLASNYLELKNASTLFLKETKSSTQDSSQSVKLGDVPVSKNDSIEDMEIGTDTDVSIQVENGSHSVRRLKTSPDRKKTHKDISGRKTVDSHSPFQSVIDSIMEESDHILPVSKSVKFENQEHFPKKEESPSWTAPLSQDIRVVLNDIYKNPFDKKPIKRVDNICDTKKPQKESLLSVPKAGQCTCSVQHGTQDFTWMKDSSNVSEFSEIVNINNDNVVDSTRLDQQIVGLNEEAAIEKKKKSPKMSKDGRKVKRKKRKPKNEEPDSDADISLVVVPKQVVKRKSKSTKPAKVCENVSTSLTQPEERRKHKPIVLDHSADFLPLDDDDDDLQRTEPYSTVLPIDNSTDDEQSNQEIVEILQSCTTEDSKHDSVIPSEPTLIGLNKQMAANDSDFMSNYEEEPMQLADTEEDASASEFTVPVSAAHVTSTNDLDECESDVSKSSTLVDGVNPRTSLLSRVSMDSLQVSPHIRSKFRLQVLEQTGLSSQDTVGTSKVEEMSTHVSLSTVTSSKRSNGKDERLPVNTPERRPDQTVCIPQSTQSQLRTGLFRDHHTDNVVDIQAIYGNLFTASSDGTIMKWNLEVRTTSKLPSLSFSSLMDFI